MITGMTHGRTKTGQGRVAVAAALVAVALLTGASGASAAKETGLFAGIYRTVCRYNVAQAEEAYQLFRLERGRDPESVAELARERFVRPPRCPAGGTLRFGMDGAVLCSVHDRQTLRVTAIGTHRTWPSTSRTPQAQTFRRKDRAVYFLAGWEPDGQRHAVEVRWITPDERAVQVDRFAGYAMKEVAAALTVSGRSAEQLPAGEYRVVLVLDGETAESTPFWLLD